MHNLRKYAQLNDSASSFILTSDGDKGYKGSFKKNFQNAKKFECSKHKGDNLVKNGAKGDKAVYERALRAPTNEALNNAKAQYSKKGSAYMAKTPDFELYLFPSGRANCGKRLRRFPSRQMPPISTCEARKLPVD